MAKTPVTILQEFMIQQHKTPDYSLICNNVGTHDPLFKWQVSGLGLTAIGSGKSKKEAKHEAAKLLLEMLKSQGQQNEEIKTNPVLNEVDTCYSPYDNTIKVNEVGALQTFCCENMLQAPVYSAILEVGPPHFKLFTIRCTVSHSFAVEASARTKKQARHRCSAKMLEKLKSCLSEYIDCSNGPSRNQNKVPSDLAKRTTYFGCPLADFYNIFTTNHYPESPTLEVIKSKHSAEDVDDPFETVKILAEELNFELDIAELPSKGSKCVVNIFLIAKPGWSFIGVGENYSMALNTAAVEAIEFLMVMSRQ